MKKGQKDTTISIRVKAEEIQELDQIVQDYQKEHPDCTSRTDAIKAILRAFQSGSLLATSLPPKSLAVQRRSTPQQAVTEKGFECECPYGEYEPRRNMVRCRVPIPSVKQFIPKNRLVDREFCDKCFHSDKYGTYGGFQIWKLQQKDEAKVKAEEQRVKTVLTKEPSRYPPKSWFSGWEYDNIPCPKADAILMCVETCFDCCTDLERKQCHSFLKFRALKQQQGEWIYE